MEDIVAWPHTGQFKVDPDPRYQEWLRCDHKRELAYRLAIERLAQQCPGAEHILDAGTGTGVWAIAAGIEFPSATIDAVDSQRANIQQARKNIAVFPTLQNRVRCEVENFNRHTNLKRYDIIITELDGGVGGNEGAKRSFARLAERLKKGGVFVPSLIKVFVAPVWLDVNHTLPNTSANPFLKNLNVHIEDPYGCYYYVYGVSGSALVATPQLLDVIIPKSGCIVRLEKRLRFRIHKSGEVSGFLVWFRHTLVPGVHLTNAPGEPVTTWGQSYFPIRPTKVKEGDFIELKFAEYYRKGRTVPHYTWTTTRNDIPIGSQSNEKVQRRRR